MIINMIKNLLKHGQYKNDIFNKLNFYFEPGKTILDVGCGDGSDAKIFQDEFGLKVSAIDIYKHNNIADIDIVFKKASIYSIPFENNSFDYIFLHDVLHHIDEDNQSSINHIRGLVELDRVLKIGGSIIILEGNRYNPLFYPHMVLLRRHNHWTQKYFLKTINTVFSNIDHKIKFNFFEAHHYPQRFIWFFRPYEIIMEKYISNAYSAYNVALINKLS